MQHIPFQDTNITGGFWQNRQTLNREATIPAVKNRFAETGRFEAMKCSWKEGMENRPHFFWDSDVAKWIEGVAYALEKGPLPEMEAFVEEIIDAIEANQHADGYYNVYFTIIEPGNRFKDRDKHELYCAGHLIEAAVAWYEATGRDRFLNCMIRYVNCIERAFMIEKTAAFVTPGHEEIELALVRLYHCTKNPRDLNLAAFFINQRGNNDRDEAGFCEFANAKYDQSHAPVREQTTAEGHCVRACYLYAGMVDLARETQDEALLNACRTIFKDITEKKMYITGGIGPTHNFEAFTLPYDLPLSGAYAETCAAISLAYFASRMLELEADSVYADIVERVLFNGILSGVSLKGDAFFYENPLEVNPALHERDRSIVDKFKSRRPIHTRAKVFFCSCCPPNIVRFFASIGGYFYGEQDGGVYVHQYADSHAAFGDASVRVQTAYPADGNITVTADNCKFVALRIPAWCKSFTLNKPYTMQKGYAIVTDTAGAIELVLEMKPSLIQASPAVTAVSGRVALQMGPIVYCLEEFDNGTELRSLGVYADLKTRVEFDEFFGANILHVEGFRLAETKGLYTAYNKTVDDGELTFIPYFGFANRGASEMLTWFLVRER